MNRHWVLGLVGMLAVGAVGCEPPQPAKPPVPVVPKPVVPPPPSDPASVTDGDVTVTYANGLRIVVKRIVGAELSAMQLYIKGGARFRTEQNAGLEQLALATAVDGGTKTLDKQAFGKKLSALGSDMGASSRHAYSSIGAKSLTREFDATFALFSEAFLDPAMPANELELQRQQQLAGIKQREVTPDERLALLVNQAVYSGHPYQHLSDGSLESVGGFTLANAIDHLASLRQTSRLELVVVGDVAAEHVRELAATYFGKLPRGNYQAPALPKPSFSKAKLTMVPAELPTNYIEGSFIAPSWGDPQFPASILAMRMLSRRLFDEVRTKRNLSYAPSARHFWSGDISRGALYVTAVDPNTTIKVMYDEVRSLQTTLVGNKELTGAKSVFLTEQLMSNESTNGQASWLAICDIVGGDWRLSRDLMDRVKAVTPEDIRAFAKDNIHNLQIVVMGNPAKVDQALFEGL